MKVYNYNKEGLYIGASKASANPKSPGDYLLPAFATFIDPPAPEKDKFPMFNGRTWEMVDDYSAYNYYDKQTKAKKKYRIGESPDLDLYTDIEPVGDVNEFKDGVWVLSQDKIDARRLRDAKEYLNSTNWYIIRLADPDRGDPIPDDVRNKRRNALEVIHEIEICEQEE
jgi:hypothetical protein